MSNQQNTLYDQLKSLVGVATELGLLEAAEFIQKKILDTFEEKSNENM